MQEQFLPCHRPGFLLKTGHRWWDTSSCCLDQWGHVTRAWEPGRALSSCSDRPKKKKKNL